MGGGSSVHAGGGAGWNGEKVGASLVLVDAVAARVEVRGGSVLLDVGK